MTLDEIPWQKLRHPPLERAFIKAAGSCYCFMRIGEGHVFIHELCGLVWRRVYHFDRGEALLASATMQEIIQREPVERLVGFFPNMPTSELAKLISNDQVTFQ